MVSHAEEIRYWAPGRKEHLVSEQRVPKTMTEGGTWEGYLKRSLDLKTAVYCVCCGRAPEKLLKPLLWKSCKSGRDRSGRHKGIGLKKWGKECMVPTTGDQGKNHGSMSSV